MTTGRANVSTFSANGQSEVPQESTLSHHSGIQTILTNVIRGFPTAYSENSERKAFKFATTFSSVICYGSSDMITL